MACKRISSTVYLLRTNAFLATYLRYLMLDLWSVIFDIEMKYKDRGALFNLTTCHSQCPRQTVTLLRTKFIHPICRSRTTLRSSNHLIASFLTQIRFPKQACQTQLKNELPFRFNEATSVSSLRVWSIFRVHSHAPSWANELFAKSIFLIISCKQV